MTEDLEITSARFAGAIEHRNALNRITGAFIDARRETDFLASSWRERKRAGVITSSIIIVSILASAFPLLATPPIDSTTIIWAGLTLAGVASFAVAIWYLITRRQGVVLDLAMFLPCIAMSASLAHGLASGSSQWSIIPGLLMISMFIYGLFLPHRPAFAMATLSILLADYFVIGLVSRSPMDVGSAAMLVGIWLACMLVVRSSALSKREKYLQSLHYEELAAQLDRNLQDLGLEKGAVERAATENAKLADELALARMAAEENAALMEIILNNMSQGVLAYGPDAKVIECNQRFAEFMHLPEELTHPGTPVEAIFEHGFKEGVIGDLQERDYAIQSARTFAGLKNFEPVVLERESAPDLFIEVRTMPMPGGGAISTVTNISERKLAEESMRFKALHDALTGLANRELFTDRLTAAIARSKRGGHYAALAMIDLDKFKPVNDLYGHPAGDTVLKEVGQLITGTVREIDTVARLGGDEFAVIFDGIAVLKDVSSPIERILNCVRQPMIIQDHDIDVSASIGVAFFPLDAETPEALERVADNALLQAKRDGRDRCVYAHRGDITMLPTAARR